MNNDYVYSIMIMYFSLSVLQSIKLSRMFYSPYCLNIEISITIQFSTFRLKCNLLRAGHFIALNFKCFLIFAILKCLHVYILRKYYEWFNSISRVGVYKNVIVYERHEINYLFVFIELFLCPVIIKVRKQLITEHKMESINNSSITPTQLWALPSFFILRNNKQSFFFKQCIFLFIDHIFLRKNRLEETVLILFQNRSDFLYLPYNLKNISFRTHLNFYYNTYYEVIKKFCETNDQKL